MDNLDKPHQLHKPRHSFNSQSRALHISLCKPNPSKSRSSPKNQYRHPKQVDTKRMQHSTSQFLRTSPMPNHDENSISVRKKQETWIANAEMSLTCTPEPAPLCLLIVPNESNSPHKILTSSESRTLGSSSVFKSPKKDAQNARVYAGAPKNVPLYLKLYAVMHRWVTRFELRSEQVRDRDEWDYSAWAAMLPATFRGDSECPTYV